MHSGYLNTVNGSLDSFHYGIAGSPDRACSNRAAWCVTLKSKKMPRGPNKLLFPSRHRRVFKCTSMLGYKLGLRNSKPNWASPIKQQSRKSLCIFEVSGTTGQSPILGNKENRGGPPKTESRNLLKAVAFMSRTSGSRKRILHLIS